MATAKKKDDPDVREIRRRIAEAARISGKTQQEIGEAMGLASKDGRKAVSRLLNADEYDPRLSSLVKLAKAIGKELRDII